MSQDWFCEPAIWKWAHLLFNTSPQITTMHGTIISILFWWWNIHSFIYSRHGKRNPCSMTPTVWPGRVTTSNFWVPPISMKRWPVTEIISPAAKCADTIHTQNFTGWDYFRTNTVTAQYKGWQFTSFYLHKRDKLTPVFMSRYWRDRCHGGIPACCASVLYTVEEGTQVTSAPVYSTLAQRAGMPPWHRSRQ
jgi:hypothetical protein